MQVIRGPRPKSVQWPRASKDGKPQQQRQPGATQQGRWRQPHVQGRTGTEHRDPGAAPRREGCRGTRARFQVGGTQSCGGRRQHSSQPQRGVEESPPTSSASVNSTMREFLGTGQEEGVSHQRVVVASPDRVDTLECRGGGRGATVGDTSSRVGAPPVSSCHSRHVRRGAEVARSSGTVVEGEGRGPSPNRPEPQAGVSSGRFRPTMRRGDARVDPRPTEGSASGHRGRPSLRSGEDLPSHVFSSTGVAADLPRTTFGDAICSGEHGEVISPPKGVICVGPGRESHRRQRVSSSDDSDFAPLVSRPVASVGVLGVFGHNTADSASVISSDDECLVRPNVGRDVAARTTQSDDGASPNWAVVCVQRLPIPTHRGRLVVEVAPNVVDVSAVVLPGSPLFVTNVSDGEVVASHPWDSDEEDELDTHSRNRADDDELLVPASVPASIGGRCEKLVSRVETLFPGSTTRPHLVAS